MAPAQHIPYIQAIYEAGPVLFMVSVESGVWIYQQPKQKR